nr:MAG TPA: hypothetical protein [Caudoviricetes sp.]
MCKREQRQNSFWLCQVQPPINKVNWCANESRYKIHFGYAKCSQQSTK